MTQRPTVVWQSHNLRKPIENNHTVFQYVVSRELAQLQKHIRWHAVHFLNRYEKWNYDPKPVQFTILFIG